MNRQRASRLPRRSSIQISNQWHKQATASATADPTYQGADPSKWYVKTQTFDARFQGHFNKEEVNGQLINDGIEKFKKNPIKYVGLMYKTDELNKPKSEQGYCLILRDRTFKLLPTGISPEGQFTLMTQEYRRLPPLKSNTLPKLCRDDYTDDMIYKGKKLHTKANKPLMPGRGMGLLDTPQMKLIGTIDPSDVKQGLIADCWLLSGISTLAEFEGGIQRLFRKTKKLDSMPFDDRPNMYTITLWDISTWTEVDIVVDERLCSRPDSASRQGEMKLLGAKPSDDGELWVPYLEKAVSIHCGGWDKISYGANCNHAWAILTGVKEQCTILRVDDEYSNWSCYAKYDPYKKEFAEINNNPWKGFQSVYTVPWPETTGASFPDWQDTSELTDEQLFQKMCEWDDGNFLMACSSKGQSDQEKTDGIVNKHAYGVVECRDNVAGTGLDMIQLRNPWGKGGELENGQFERAKGPGWKKYPQLKRELNPDQDSPGVFWLTREEFFKYYDKIYMSASDMSEFLGLKPPKQSKPKEETEADSKKRKVEAPKYKQDTANTSMSPAKKTKSISKQASPKKVSPIKAKPKGFVKVEKNLPKKGKGKKSGWMKPTGFKKMIPKNKQAMAKAKLEREKKEKEKLEKERLEQERLEKEKQEKAKQERERQEREKLEKEKQEKQKLEREKQAKAKQERDRQEKERKAKQQLEKQERDRLQGEKKEREKQEKERAEREKKAQKQEQDRLQKLERERLQQERKERERLEKEKKANESKSPSTFAKFIRPAKKADSPSDDIDSGSQKASKELQEKDSIIADLQRRLDEAEKESLELRSKTTTLSAIQEDLEAEAMAYEEQLETKAVIIDTLTDELNQAYESAEPQESAEELREKNAQLRKKTEELSGKNAEILKLKKELAKARSSALAQSGKKDSIKSDQEALVLQHRREIEEKNTIIASMRKEIDNGKRRISALQDNASELEGANQGLESLNKRQKRKIEQLQSDDGDVSSLRADLQKAKRTIQNLSQSKSESQRDLAKKDKRIDFLRSELREANQAIQTLERKIGGSRDRDRVRINQLKKQLDHKDAELESKDTKLKSAERAAVESRKRLREKDDRINSVLNQLQHSRKEFRALDDKHAGIRKKLKSSEHHVSFLDTQLEEAKHLIQTLEQRNRVSRDREVVRLRKQLESKQEEGNSQKHQLQQAKDDLKSGRIALREKVQESIENRGALRQVRQEFQALEQEKNDMYVRENRKLKQLQSRLNTTEAALETEREKRKQANDRADELEEELNRERNKRQRLAAEEQGSDSKRNQAAQSGQLLKQKEEELNFMGKKLRRMTLHQQQSSRHLQNEVAQQDRQISDLQQQVDELQRENEALYEKNANQTSQSKKVHELETQLDKQKSISEMWKEDITSLKDAVDDQKNRIEHLNHEIANRDSLIQSLEEKVADQAGTVAQKSNADARHAQLVADLNRKLEVAQEQLSRRRVEGTSDGSSRDRMDELERELWEARDDSDSLRHTIKLQEAELEEKEAVINSLTRRLKERPPEPSFGVNGLDRSESTEGRPREPRLTTGRARERSSTAEAAETLNFTPETARESGSFAESAKHLSFPPEKAIDRELSLVQAREQRPSPKEDRLHQSRDEEKSRGPEEASPGNQEVNKSNRRLEHLYAEYDTLPGPEEASPGNQEVNKSDRRLEHMYAEYDTLPNYPTGKDSSQEESSHYQGAQEQSKSMKEDRPPPRGESKFSLEPLEQAPGNHGIFGRNYMEPGYDELYGKRTMGHVSQKESFDDLVVQEQRPNLKENVQQQPGNEKIILDPEETSSGNQEVATKPQEIEQLRTGHDSLVENLNYKHASRKDDFENGVSGYGHIRSPVLPKYEARTKSDPPEEAETENSPGYPDDSLVDLPPHLLHRDYTPPEVDGEKRARRGGLDEPEGDKGDEGEHSLDAPEARNEFDESKIAEEPKWKDDSGFQALPAKDKHRMNHRDHPGLRQPPREESNSNNRQPRGERSVCIGDFNEPNGTHDSEWGGGVNMHEWDNWENRHDDFKEARKKNEEKWNDEPRNDRPKEPRHVDGDRYWNEEPDWYMSNYGEQGRARNEDYDGLRIPEDYKWNNERDMVSSNHRQHRKKMRYRGNDERMDRDTEKWGEEMGLPASQSDRLSKRRDYNESPVMEDGKWNEELGIYIQPEIASRYYQDVTHDASVSRPQRETKTQRRATNMDTSGNYSSPWYYDSQSPIGDWNDRWESNLRGRAEKDNRNRRNEPGGIRLHTREDFEDESWGLDGDDRQRDGGSYQFSANAHIADSTSSWAESTGSRKQRKLLSQRAPAKQDGGADSINDYLARLFEKVQATKSELEATQQRLNHTVGRHLVHE